MKTELRKTAYWMTGNDGMFKITDDSGRIHSWFSLPVARQLAREHGCWYEKSTTNSIKEVVTEL